ncbi:MAG: hypothetical protein R2750_10720 [Bacteroidales bacterium]
MLIIADKRIPDEAKLNLQGIGEVLFLESENIVYETISGHPDIFFCQVNNKLIIAPNLPAKYKLVLKKKNIEFEEGEENVGLKFPETAKYNVVATNNFLMHNFRYTDSKILEHQGDLYPVHLNQGYSRCNLLPLKNDHFITSDHGIYRILKNFKVNVLMVNPSDIILPGVKHGFFGGCCGVLHDTVFIIGSLSKFKDGEKVSEFLSASGYKIVELYNGPLFDGGSILFIDD